MSFLPTSLSFRPLAAFAVFALVAACASKTSSSPQTECTSKPYPTLACGSIESCATGAGKDCTGTTLSLPDGQKFKCASCTDCKQAQDDAVAACGGGTPAPDAGEQPGPTTGEDSGTGATEDAGEGTADEDAGS
jgi:hypothetical protein